MESDWFDVSFILRELIEVCTQTSQAYNLSRLIARQSLNQGVVGLLVINCWSTPLVQSAFSHNPPLERVVCLTVNLVLAFASTVLVPLMLIVPYAFDFDFGAAVFPDELVYNEAWLVNVLMESQHALFVRDGGDMTMKTLAHLGIIINIVCLRSILRRRQTSKPINKVVLAASGSTGVTRSVAPADEFRAITQLGPSLVSLVHVPIFAKLRQKRWFRRVPRRLLIIGPVTQFTLICWGFAVLTCHTLALYSTATPPDHVRCSLSTRPWLVRSFTCAVVELNCHSLGTKGAADILDAALRQITSLSVFYVAFTLCPALEIPPAVSGLGNLKGIEIYNSTITKWPSKAAIRAEYHPFISVIYLVRVNMSELPKGLQHPDFPPSLMDIQMCSVNLTSLPSVVADLWPRHLTFLYWELSGLTEIPDVIGRFQIDRLSFAGNDIKEITPTIFSGQRLETFSVADNPSLSQLPPRVGDTSLMYQLQLDFTNISIIARRCNVSASATPLCVNNLSSSHGVGCKLVDRGTVSMYPLEIKDKQRRQLAW
ncbi:TPA: hypothetical protein N0F65_006298 [Lagenidium giganteum]|uniref:Leucine-rich repeat domain, L domain-like n=1 Tax=Lagenidium giganteum TaxID=4803 RepID=A0AAV2YPY9_9STRA|nr:TPA: hypothetical protein N0F65_006298 [Lagenidium giganteum]